MSLLDAPHQLVAPPVRRPGTPAGRTPRVLHVSQPVDGGVARVVAGLVTDQRRRGWEVHVACPPDGELPDAVRASGAQLLPWHAVRSPGPSVPGEVAALRRIVAEADPQVVHLHSAKAGLAGRLAIRGRRRTVFQPHAWSFEAVTGPVRSASRSWERLAQRWTALTLCVSEAELATGRAAGLTGRSVVVPNGVDPDAWMPQDRATARAALATSPTAPTVLCVGRLARQKGQDMMLEAWAGVRQAVPAAQLVIVGTGPDEAPLRARADDSVRFVPGERLAEWYAAADVVAVPSRWEAGLPLVAIEAMEAMASRRSVMAFDVAGIRESLGGGGVAVPPSDVDAFRAALIARLLDPAATALEAEAGRFVATTRFTAARAQAAVADHLLGLTVRR